MRYALIIVSLSLFGFAIYHFYIGATMSLPAIAEACEAFDQSAHEKGCFPELGHFLFGFIFLGPAMIIGILALALRKKPPLKL
ncbi:MAG: hypothetical protein QM684_26685 [Rhizobium sp.]|uniref:hypothetical protein n=1 Tax=Rhizobium sp. SYY.PMSO TaxID=3382192 RepID=UPI000DE08677